MILTTHDMNDIETLCNRVLVIGHGQLLYDGKLDTLRKRYSPFLRIDATLEYKKPYLSIEGAQKVTVDGLNWIVYFDPEKVPTHRMVETLSGQLPLKSISVVKENIDHIITSMYGEMCL